MTLHAYLYLILTKTTRYSYDLHLTGTETGSERLGTRPKCRAVISGQVCLTLDPMSNYPFLLLLLQNDWTKKSILTAEDWISFNQRLSSISSVAVNICTPHRPIHMYSKYLHDFQTVYNLNLCSLKYFQMKYFIFRNSIELGSSFGVVFFFYFIEILLTYKTIVYM